MGKRHAASSVALGALATLTLPVAIFATRYSDSYGLVDVGFAIPIALAAGVVAVVLARRARALDQATLARAGAAKAVRMGRLLGILGLCVAASAVIALAVYEVLLAVS